jgi:hypothetical protein
MSSMPLNRMRAQRKFLKPGTGRVRRLIGVSRSALRAPSAARFAPLLSIATVSGSPFWSIDFSK